MFIFDDYSLYLWSQWNAKNLYQLASIFAIIIAATQFAGEVSKNTMSFYLTRPVTRRDGFLGKIAAGLLVFIFIFGGGTIIFMVTSSIMGYEADWARLSVALGISLTWVAVYYLLACIVSTLNREPIMAGIVAGVIGLFLSLPGIFAVSRSFSIFYQMRAVDYFVTDTPLLWSLIPGLAVNGVLLLIGLRVFERKDF